MILLNAAQRIMVHGWTKPMSFLTWQDICQSKITFKGFLSLGIDVRDLHRLQSDIREWIRCKNVSFDDVPYMTLWPLHPFKDLGGTVLDILNQKYSFDTLKLLNITYDDLKKLSATPQMLHLLHFVEREWHELGLTSEVVCNMSEGEVYTIFLKSKKAVLSLMDTYT